MSPWESAITLSIPSEVTLMLDKQEPRRCLHPPQYKHVQMFLHAFHIQLLASACTQVLRRSRRRNDSPSPLPPKYLCLLSNPNFLPRLSYPCLSFLLPSSPLSLLSWTHAIVVSNGIPSSLAMGTTGESSSNWRQVSRTIPVGWCTPIGISSAHGWEVQTWNGYTETAGRGWFWRGSYRSDRTLCSQ